MNILILGDVFGPSGREAIKDNLKNLINQFKIDFTVLNGENAADDGMGLTQQAAENVFQ